MARAFDRLAYRERRRMLGGSMFPPHLRRLLPPGAFALAAIIRLEVRRRGHCSQSVAQLGARCGLHRTAVKAYVGQLRRLRLIDVEPQFDKRSGFQLPNRITIAAVVHTLWKTLWATVDNSPLPRFLHPPAPAGAGGKGEVTFPPPQERRQV